MTLADFAPPAPALYLSEAETARRVLFLTLPPGWTGEMHPSPQPQFVICLEGRMRFEAGDGEAREVRPGDVIRCTDTTGSGHRSAVLGTENAHLAIVQI